jgi:hypothetical protein
MQVPISADPEGAHARRAHHGRRERTEGGKGGNVAHFADANGPLMPGDMQAIEKVGLEVGSAPLIPEESQTWHSRSQEWCIWKENWRHYSDSADIFAKRKVDAWMA